MSKIKPIKTHCATATFDIHDHIGDSLEDYIEHSDLVDNAVETEFLKASHAYWESLQNDLFEPDEIGEKYFEVEKKYQAEVIKNFLESLDDE